MPAVIIGRSRCTPSFLLLAGILLGIAISHTVPRLVPEQAAADEATTLRLLVEAPMSATERAEWRERMALFNGIREPGPKPRNRRYPARSRGPRSRQLAIKLPSEDQQ